MKTSQAVVSKFHEGFGADTQNDLIEADDSPDSFLYFDPEVHEYRPFKS